MTTTNIRFVTKNGLDNNSNSITNLGATGASLTLSGANALTFTTTGTTGITLPAVSWVLALNCLQKSMILTPLEPRAGPTGGDGLAAPPRICNLIIPATSFAIILNLRVYCESLTVTQEALYCYYNRQYLQLIFFFKLHKT